MDKKFLLLLGANQFQRERALVGAERVSSGKVVTVSNLAPFHINKYPLTTICSVETNPEQLLTDICKYVELTKTEPAAVIPLNDFVLNAGLSVAEYFKLPYNTKQCISICRTKDLMKSILKNANLQVVESFRFSTLDEAYKLAERISYPIVIKPLNFGGSGGVIKVETSSHLKSAFLHTQQHLQKFAEHYDSDSSLMLMEEYITTKREVSAEVINSPAFRSVIGVTDKFLSDEPYFSEIGHLVPSSFSKNKSIFQKIEEGALKACEALGIQYGMAHVEMKVTSGGDPIIIEVGARTAGDGIMDLYEKATGKNIYELHCKSFLQQLTKNDVPEKFLNAAAIGYMHPKEGRVKKINTKSLISKYSKSVDMISIRAQIDQKVEVAKDWSTRYGFIEYTLINNPAAKDFDLIENTNQITQSIFEIE